MADERWAQISRIYDEAASLTPVDRAPFLRQACGSDEALRAEIESLLRDDTRVNALLDPKSLHRTLIGQRVGGYEIRSLLGVGGMGEVYRARDPKLDRDVAIKVLPVGLASDGERLARLQREARVLASLNHPNIGGIHGFEDASGVPALVLELVEGDTLAERLEKGPIPVSEALHIARQIADALETAHEHGVVHRDLKPANIKITPEGTVKVLDFGLAKAVQRTESPLQTSGLSHEGHRPRAIYQMRADGATPEGVLVPADSDPRTNTWALDWGRDFVVAQRNRNQPPSPELWALPLSGDRKPFLYQPRFSDSAAISPNGRWLAYEINDGGVDQVIVQSFPDRSQSRDQISSKGGLNPRWNRNGRELFYIDSVQRLIAVSVLTDGPFKVQQTTELFTAPSLVYDVSPRGDRFLFNVSSTALANPPPINLVLNWTTGLK